MSLTLIWPFNVIQGQILSDKLKGHIWLTLCISYKLWSNLSDVENDLLNNSMKSISWQLINIIPKKLCARNKGKLSDSFWENLQKVAKQPNFTFFWPFGPWKMTFRAIQSNPSFDSSLVLSLGSFLHNSQIWPFSDVSDLEKWPLERFSQIHLLTVH